jgi:hypothetical protein
MLEKYKSNESHFAIRVVIFFFIVLCFVLFSVFFIDNNQRSCLGPPALLPFAFIGLPLITVLLLLDLIVLAFLKAFNWKKLLINAGLFLSMILFFYIIY